MFGEKKQGGKNSIKAGNDTIYCNAQEYVSRFTMFPFII